MRHILLIGSNGYLGVPLTRNLKNHNYDVYTLNRHSSNNPTTHNLINSNYLKNDYLNDIIVNNKIDTVINLAWVGSYGKARFDATIQNENEFTNIYLINKASQLGFRLINLGTISELVKDNSGQFTSEYAKQKANIHKLMDTAIMSNTINGTWVMLGNVFGGDDKTGRFMSSLITNLSSNKTVSMNTDGTQMFYPLFIDNFENYMLKIIENGACNDVQLFDDAIQMNSFINKAKSALSSSSDIVFGKNIEKTVTLAKNHDFNAEYSLEKSIQLAKQALVNNGILEEL